MEHTGNDISEGVQAVIYDAMYNTCQSAKLSNFEHDLLCLLCISHFSEMLSAVMDKILHLLSSAVQCKTWY